MGKHTRKSRSPRRESAAQPAPQEPIESIPVTALGPAPARVAWDDGSKFDGGFGETLLYQTDYWTLRARSRQIFETNLYARGLIRRLVTNEINTGLEVEVAPEEKILGVPDDSLADWSEIAEIRFGLWGRDAELCDVRERSTFGALQEQIRMQALIEGDVLVTLRQDQRTGLPRIALVSGCSVRTPASATPTAGNRIEHGVELDSLDRHVAFWVTQRDGTSKRLPAFGEKSGRRLAWLVYGTDKMLDDGLGRVAVRGKPMLSLVLQSLREIDRYRDATLRKAVVNSMLAMFIEKTQDKPGTAPITGGGAQRRGAAVTAQTEAGARTFRSEAMIPGLVIEELQQGETPKPFVTNGTTEGLGPFEAAIIAAVAWANEIPPEILMLSFGNNYAASQAAINEFRMYLNRMRTRFGETVCQPIYVEWLLSEVIAQRIRADRFLESWRNTSMYDVFGAWTSADWSGHIKPAVDLVKLVRAYSEAIAQGLITRARAARELFGMKFSRNAKQLRLENEAMKLALEPIAPPAPVVAPTPPAAPPKKDADLDPEDDADDAEDGDEDPKDDEDDEDEAA